MESLPEFADLVGGPVEVQLLKGGAGSSCLIGNLYTADPITNDLVLITFNSEKKPETLKWLPRDSIKQVSCVNGTTTPGCHPKTTELDDLMSKLFRVEKKYNADDSEEKKSALMIWLKRNHVEVRQDGSSLLIFGSVRVEAPFTSADCYCDNEIVLRRVRAIIDKCPSA